MESNERMSQIVIHNNTIYLAGQTAEDTTKDVTEQTKEVLATIEKYLAMAGSDKHHILSATIFLKNINEDFEKMNAVWDSWIPAGKTPGRATVEAHLCEPGYLVEILVVAAVA